MAKLKKRRITWSEVSDQLATEIALLGDIKAKIDANPGGSYPPGAEATEDKLIDFQEQYNDYSRLSGAEKPPESPEEFSPLFTRDRRARVSC